MTWVISAFGLSLAAEAARGYSGINGRAKDFQAFKEQIAATRQSTTNQRSE